MGLCGYSKLGGACKVSQECKARDVVISQDCLIVNRISKSRSIKPGIFFCQMYCFQ